MPELPEVETIRRGLNKFILNKNVSSVKILCDKSFIGPKEVILGQKIINIRRFGKALIFDFENGVSMMVHLRMTGQLIFRASGEESGQNYLEMIEAGDFKTTLYTEKSFAGGHPNESFYSELPNKQTRVLFEICKEDEANSGASQVIGTLYFNDQRKFGFCKVIETSEIEADSFIKKLAKEPWAMSVEEFKKNLMRHKNAEIKPTILDQSVIAGLGNIYADEALYMTKIHPERLTLSLSDSEIAELLEAAGVVMQRSIDSGGSTMATYVKADGTKGNYLEKFAQVFRREGEPCNRCGTEIIKLKVAGRGTHICPNCQKKFQMIYLIDGDDRKKAEQAARDFLGTDIEIIDADNLEKQELVSIFQGTTLFMESRHILIKDLSLKKELFLELPKFLQTEHQVAILEQKLDKRSATYKELAEVAKAEPQKIKIESFKLPEQVDTFLVFRVFDIALTDGKRAVKLMREAEEDNNPYATIGAWTKKAVDLFASKKNAEKERRILKRLAEIDMLLKQTNFSKDPWVVLESFLIELSSL